MKQKTSSAVTFSVMSLGFIWSLIFSALKLAHVINWSWWWIASPSILTVVLVLAAVVYVICKVSPFEKDVD